MVYEAVTVILLVVVCFLLYKLYRIKYGEGGQDENSLSLALKRDLGKLDDDGSGVFESRFRDIEKRIQELEKTVEKNNNFVERLAEEMS